jgi:hypothetical protein
MSTWDVYTQQSDAGKQSLRAQVLSSEEALACALRWQEDSLRYAVERAGFWMRPPPHFGGAATGNPAADTGIVPPNVGGDTAAAGTGGFVRMCGIELPQRQQQPSADASASAVAPLVLTEAVSRNLEAAALVLCQQNPLLLEGPPGQAPPC